jgi:hypothetical protein
VEGRTVILLSDSWWSDPGWIGVLIGILAIIVTVITSIVISQKQRMRKEITFGIISATPVLSVNEEVKSKVLVFYDGKPIRDMLLIVLRLWNSGNVSVLPTDYVETITFDFGTGAEILVVTLYRSDRKPGRQQF